MFEKNKNYKIRFQIEKNKEEILKINNLYKIDKQLLKLKTFLKFIKFINYWYMIIH